jgi:hypothetical protein
MPASPAAPGIPGLHMSAHGTTHDPAPIAPVIPPRNAEHIVPTQAVSPLA